MNYLIREGIANLPFNRQNAASGGEARRLGVVTTPSLSVEASAPRQERGRNESFATTCLILFSPKTSHTLAFC
ncbi:MAG: hypothetical protein IJJ26_05615, partial [Victivallales bacterium]|nr:hypothetical protein [Victivallales bacterium]